MPLSTHPANASTADRPSPAPRADATARRKCFIVDDAVRDALGAALGGNDIELAGFASAQELLDAWGPQHERAHHLGATVVAEDIETRSELQRLTEMGCDIGQGFLFAPPMRRDKLIALLHELAQKFAPA